MRSMKKGTISRVDTDIFVSVFSLEHPYIRHISGKMKDLSLWSAGIRLFEEINTLEAWNISFVFNHVDFIIPFRVLSVSGDKEYRISFIHTDYIVKMSLDLAIKSFIEVEAT